jgi:hypothetical protein
VIQPIDQETLNLIRGFKSTIVVKHITPLLRKVDRYQASVRSLRDLERDISHGESELNDIYKSLFPLSTEALSNEHPCLRSTLDHLKQRVESRRQVLFTQLLVAVKDAIAEQYQTDIAEERLLPLIHNFFEVRKT